MSSMAEQNPVHTEKNINNGDLHIEELELKEVRVQDETTNEMTCRETEVANPLLEEVPAPNIVVEVEDYRLNDDKSEWSDDDTVEEKDVSSLKYGLMSRAILGCRDFCRRKLAFVVSKTRGYLLSVILLLGYLAYFIAAMCYSFEDESSHRLLGCTILGLIIVARKLIAQLFRKLCFLVTGSDHVTLVWKKRLTTCTFFSRWLMYGLMCGIMIWVIVDKAIADPNNLRSIPGILIIMLICLFCSNSPHKVNYHTIFWSVGLQFLLALYVLKWKYGKASVTWVQERISEFNENSDAGSRLVFGDNYKEHYLIFGALPLFFFINGMMTVLYYCGAMQLIINVVGNTLTFVLGTSAVESMAVAAGVFMEGVATITAFKPYLNDLSKSELFLIMTSCFSSIGSTFLAILSQIGVSVDLLIGAMLLSAPATFTVCKLLMPETKLKKRNKMSDIGNLEKNKYPNILDAFQSGAAAMASAFINVVISAFALVCLISWVNKTLEWFGDRVGVRNVSIELIASYLLYPVALGMGVELEDCRKVAAILGFRLGSSNIIGFLKLAELKRNRLLYENYLTQFGSNATLTFQNDDVILDMLGQTLKQGFISVRSEAILTYSLCGLSSILSAAINMGVMCAFLPKKRKWISRICFAALIAGNLANTMTGCFACLFF
ncbi:solute carrier family 28 member 3-like isoform X1 [Biomphalaria glabrata]|uniref:Solute carrier family 28 member 3-like isoform X1 n=1 Tax=Biomphalaria glabrata TaxID=6526 RepID=A0A9W3B152_BIOGL|nr:solute carrier family 28 member 3-like isoform X1 [Biomphalaria glabrata]